MSDGINKVMLGGSLGADPELRYTQSGSAVLNMRVATNESWLDKDKVRQERTEWHSAVVFGPRGEALAKILRKGMFVLIDGSLRTESYEKDGVTRYKTEVIARDVILPPRGKGSDGEHGAAGSAGAALGNGGTAGNASPPTQGARGGHGHASTPKPASGGGAKSTGDFEVKFGRDRGKMMSQVEDLTWLRGAIERDINDPAKAQYAQKAKGQLAAIDEEIARRKSDGTPAGDAGSGDEGGYGGYGSPDDEIPFASCDAAHEQPWAQHKPRRYGMT